MKKIVIVSGNRLAPAQTGGQVHSLSIARALARMGHAVRIMSIAGRKEDYRLAQALRAATQHVEIEPGLSEDTHLGGVTGMLQTVTRRLRLPRIWQYYFLRYGRLPRSLRAALHAADIVMSDLPYCPRIPGPWRAKPWFLISHNLEHRLLEQGGRRERRWAAWMRAVEGAAARDYTDIFACAEEDQAFFRGVAATPEPRVPMIRCGVDPQDYVVSSELRRRARADLGVSEDEWLFLFSGSGFGPNQEAFAVIQEFCRHEAEFLARHRARVVVAGSVSPRSFRDSALIVTGRVPEVLPYFAAADCGLNMVTRGSGSNVKLFEYLAARLPVISTPFGTRGTPLSPEQDYLPCSAQTLREVMATFMTHSRAHWRQHAEGVWHRHHASCDIYALVAAAVAEFPVFQP